ncbi:MAG: Transamidase GatB domain protein [Candidatus Kapaibacterium sp.]|nr:MAG: Transamidase GatB domain protein [Candidatus Kapabacteria bacterium]
MNLEQKVGEELKKAIKEGDQIRMDALRSIRASILEFKKSGIGREMNEEDEIKILNSLAKKRKEAIEMYEQGGRIDLAEKERKELEIIKQFLPEQLSEEEIRKIVASIIQELNASSPSELGKVMGRAMKDLKGKADGSLVQSIARELLTQTSK